MKVGRGCIVKSIFKITCSRKCMAKSLGLCLTAKMKKSTSKVNLKILVATSDFESRTHHIG